MTSEALPNAAVFKKFRREVIIDFCDRICSAARRIALRIRGYVPQRQTESDITLIDLFVARVLDFHCKMRMQS